MHPGFMGWWKHRHGHSCQAGCEHAQHGGWGHHHGGGHHGHGHHHDAEAHASGDFDDGGGFGVRRPLRFMAHKLDLSEEQVAGLAGILDELKTERAQASVDHRRSIGAFADAVSAGDFDAEKARAAGDSRVKSAEQLRDAVVLALGKVHALLDAEQRKKLAYLLRTGVLTI